MLSANVIAAAVVAGVLMLPVFVYRHIIMCLEFNVWDLDLVTDINGGTAVFA